MTSEESKEYMAKTEVHQLFEGMLTGLLYHKPKDHLAYLEQCISIAKNEKNNIKWNTFLDLDKKPLPPIPKGDGPLRTEGQDLHTFPTEPGAEIKNKVPLPPIGMQGHSIDDDDEKDLTEKNIITPNESEEEEEVDIEFSGQRIVYVLGGPGAGKGTICAHIVNKYHYCHLSAGDLLRNEVAKGNERGHMIQELMTEGKLVPQKITIALLRDAMREHSHAPGFLIDGFPREISQGEQFEREVVDSDFVLSLECAEDVMQERLLKRAETSGRSDDNLETIKKRFATFVEKTIPVIEHYQKQDKAHRIDANRSVDEVCIDVFRIFDGLLPKVKKTVHRKKKKVAQNGEEEEEEWEEFSGQRVVFVLGGPGSGKGTQCTRIVDKFGYTHLSTGDLLRNEVETGSERGQKLAEIMKDGTLVPQDIVIDLLRDAMLANSETSGFLIDGFPREISQAEQFEDEIIESHFTLFFECSEEVMEERLLKRGETSGREDDNADTIKKRFQTFVEKTMPVIGHVEKQGKLKRIDANRSVDEVFQDVCAIFGVLPKLERKRKKGNKGGDSSTDEFGELVEDLGRAMEGKGFRRRRYKKKKKTDDPPKSPVYEEAVVAEEFIPLNDEEIAKTGKGLLNARVIFVIGGPGSGKGTQCARIVDKFGYTHLSTGDLLRNEVQSESTRGKTIAEIMKKGELVPNGIILELLRQAMVKQPNTKGFLVDGFPRELEQGLEFEKELAPCEFLLYFECLASTMKGRLMKRRETGDRADDNEETISSRLSVFEEQTMPVIRHYEEEGKVNKVSAEGNVDEVFEDVSKIFAALPARKAATIHDFEVVFIIGGPGTERSELCKLLTEKSGRTHISVGQLLRKEAKKDTERGKEIASKVSEGKLVSPEHVLAVLTEKLTHEEKNFTGYVIEGYPRTEEQLKNFTERVSDFSHVILLDSTEEELSTRAKEQMTGEEGEEERLKTRLQEYVQNTKKMVDDVLEDERIIKVSAARTLEETYEQIKDYVIKDE